MGKKKVQIIAFPNKFVLDILQELPAYFISMLIEEDGLVEGE